VNPLGIFGGVCGTVGGRGEAARGFDRTGLLTGPVWPPGTTLLGLQSVHIVACLVQHASHSETGLTERPWKRSLRCARGYTTAARTLALIVTGCWSSTRASGGGSIRNLRLMNKASHRPPTVPPTRRRFDPNTPLRRMAAGVGAPIGTSNIEHTRAQEYIRYRVIRGTFSENSQNFLTGFAVNRPTGPLAEKGETWNISSSLGHSTPS